MHAIVSFHHECPQESHLPHPPDRPTYKTPPDASKHISNCLNVYLFFDSEL